MVELIGSIEGLFERGVLDLKQGRRVAFVVQQCSAIAAGTKWAGRITRG